MVEEAEGSKKRSALEILEEAKKGKQLREVDHAKMEYAAFRKNLYIVPRLLRLPEERVAEMREDLHVKVRGKGCPAPVESWEQCGLSDRILQVLSQNDLKSPFAIQRQAIPAIMCGRDVIGVAKTGSGKTLAFLLPMLRHILDQPPLLDGEGPIGLVMAPSRELAYQIYSEAKKFSKPLGLRVTCIYGGAGVAEQIADLKRGSEIVVCTPGRMIDILCMQAGKLVSLRRVTMVVMDEADRMFDMGFEPQIRMITQNVRPDRQTVLFSATFPKQIEKLARAVLKLPLEIVVGERSTVNKDITQIIEVHEEEDKFLRLLQLLGVWYEKGSVLIFVDKQEKCDQLYAGERYTPSMSSMLYDLLKLGYPCLSLHGGKDQVDRDHTLHEFKTGVKTVMVATSVAGRGLDVPDIVCVINYHCPNHMEDYVHRVGRTGRAGRKGTAYTFVSQKEEQYAPSMAKLLTKAGVAVPPELASLVQAFKDKVSRGEAQYATSGFDGKGFSFDAGEMNAEQKVASMQKRLYEKEQGLDADEEEEEEDTQTTAAALAAAALAKTGGAAAAAPAAMAPPAPVVTADMTPLERARALAAQFSRKADTGSAGGGVSVSGGLGGGVSVGGGGMGMGGMGMGGGDAVARAKAIALQMTAAAAGLSRGGGSTSTGAEPEQHFSDELEINDYPPQARRKITNKNAIDDVIERTGVAIIARGSYIPPGKKLEAGERRLHLLIEGTSAMSVKQARLEIVKVKNTFITQIYTDLIK
ncbi:P-loop containing nucleoside triphosphate hydrolase protein [Ochromonadaceae sp. CCMP2298]|nr:P-loop containing nucleoside triphosphate hydrolase protein [Ochromonadaceae sp. CCMP2298]